MGNRQYSVSLDEDIAKKARKLAIDRDVSFSRLIEQLLEQVVKTES